MGQAYARNAKSNLGYLRFRADSSCSSSSPLTLRLLNAFDGYVGLVETHASAYTDSSSSSQWFDNNVAFVNELSTFESQTEGFLAHVADGIVADLRQFRQENAPGISALRVHSTGSSPFTVPSPPELRDHVQTPEGVVAMNV
jgi:hypothetical protein